MTKEKQLLKLMSFHCHVSFQGHICVEFSSTHQLNQCLNGCGWNSLVTSLFEGMIWMFQLSLQYWACWIRAKGHSLVMPLLLPLRRRSMVLWVCCILLEYLCHGISSNRGNQQKWDHNFAMKFGDYTQIYDPVILHLETSGSHIYLMLISGTMNFPVSF